MKILNRDLEKEKKKTFFLVSLTNNNNFTILLKLVGITVCSAEYAVHRLSLSDVESDIWRKMFFLSVYENVVQVLSTYSPHYMLFIYCSSGTNSLFTLYLHTIKEPHTAVKTS